MTIQYRGQVFRSPPNSTHLSHSSFLNIPFAPIPTSTQPTVYTPNLPPLTPLTLSPFAHTQNNIKLRFHRSTIPRRRHLSRWLHPEDNIIPEPPILLKIAFIQQAFDGRTCISDHHHLRLSRSSLCAQTRRGNLVQGAVG